MKKSLYPSLVGAFLFLLVFGLGFYFKSQHSPRTSHKELSSIEEVYQVTTQTSLRLRAKPSTDSEILMELTGTSSPGGPAYVSLLEQPNEDAEWWKVLYISSDGETTEGYIYIDGGKNVERSGARSYIWSSGELVEHDEEVCHKVSSEENQQFYRFDHQNRSIVTTSTSGEEKHLMDGALLIQDHDETTFKVVSQPKVSVRGEKTFEVGSQIELSSNTVKNLKDSLVLLSLSFENSERYEGVILLDYIYKPEQNNESVQTYQCCAGKSCKKYLKLLAENPGFPSLYVSAEDSLDENFILSAAEAHQPETGEIDASSVEENQLVQTSPRPPARPDDLIEGTYTNLEEVFLGPSSPASRGGAKLYELKAIDEGGSLLRGPCGTYNYNPENLGGLNGGDRYIDKAILPCFLATLQSFRREHPDTVLQWGDISRGDRVSFRPDHSSHQTGKDIDMRLIRNDNKLLGCHVGWAEYDREKNVALIREAIRYGADPIYLKDPEVYNNIDEVRNAKGHHNHIHFRYTRTCTNVRLDERFCPRADFVD